MGMIKIVRKMFKSLSGSSTRRSLVLGLFLGLGVGLTPGFNLTSFLFLAAFLFLNTSAGVGALGVFIGKLLLFPLAPVLYFIGYTLIEKAGLSGLVRFTANTPLLALLNWEVYAVVGSLVIIGLVAFPVSYFSARWLLRVQDKLSATRESDKKWVRTVMGILTGKKPLEANDALFDKKRCIAGGIVLVFVLGLLLFVGNIGLRTGLEKGLGKANGAEVNLSAARLNVFTGNLTLKNLEMTDPENPALNSFAAKKIVVDLSLSALLTKSFVIDEVVCGELGLDVVRKKSGLVFTPDGNVATEQPKANPDGGSPLDEKLGKTVQYTKKIKSLNDKLQRLLKMIKSTDKGESADHSEAEAYLARRAEELIADRPLWTIRSARAENVSFSDDLPSFTIEASNLSSAPHLLDASPAIKAVPDPEAMKELKEQATGAIKDKIKDLF
jgi:uncharacterized protein (TIGR03546 family)